jgi:hypothetical protein
MIKLNAGCVEIVDLSISEHDLTNMPCHSLLEDFFILLAKVFNFLDLQSKYH